MGLAIETERGRRFVEKQQKVADIISQLWKVDVADFPPDAQSKVDCILIKNHVIRAIVEIKVRDLSEKKLKSFGDIILTFEKIETGRRIAKLLCVPFWFVVHLVKDNKIAVWEISDKEGEYSNDFRLARTKTATTCNGGEIRRMNAFLKYSDCKIYQWNEGQEED